MESTIWGSYEVPLLMRAVCVLPLNSKIDIKPNSVVYLGHIDAVIRKRKGMSEQRAGALVPLIDNAVAGFSNGTFDVAINDEYNADMKLFQTQFPALSKVNVKKDILPPWVRPTPKKEDAK